MFNSNLANRRGNAAFSRNVPLFEGKHNSVSYNYSVNVLQTNRVLAFNNVNSCVYVLASYNSFITYIWDHLHADIRKVFI